MKRFKSQPSITVAFMGNGTEIKEEIKFDQFLLQHLDNVEGVKTLSKLRELNRTAKAVEKGGDWIEMEEPEYKFLLDALKTPRFIPRIGRQLMAFYDVVEAAETVKVTERGK